MILKELRLNNFGKFHDKTITLKDGINLIYGDNEAGKSTIHSFIKGMLFGVEKLRGRASKEDTYTKYQPWDVPGAYNGSMDIEITGKSYRIHRNFDKNTKNFSMIDLETGRELNLSPEELKDFYGGLTEAGYRNTISIEQLKVKTENQLVEEVRNYITNLSLSKSNEVDVSKALHFLQDKKKEIEIKQIDAKIVSLEMEIAEGLACETRIDGLTVDLNKIEEQLKGFRKNQDTKQNHTVELGSFPTVEAYQEYLEQFPAIREKYRNYCDKVSERKSLLEKMNALQNQLQIMKEEQKKDVWIHNHIAQLQSYETESISLEDKKNRNSEKEAEVNKNNQKRLRYCSLTMIASLLGLILFFNNHSLMTGIFLTLFGMSGMSYLYLSHKIHVKQDEFNQNWEQYEIAIKQLQSKKKEILSQYNLEDEEHSLEVVHELKKQQEEAVRREISIEHVNKQIQDSQNQIAMEDERIRILNNDLLVYMNQAVPDLRIQMVNDANMSKLQEYIMEQKHKILIDQEADAREYESYKLKKEKLIWELNGLEGNEEKLLKNKEYLKELEQQRSENQQELAAIQLAYETINSLSVDIHDSFGTRLNQLMSNLTGEITAGKYTDVKVDEKLNIKVGHKDIFVLLDKLSTGTINQLYFALRMAISNLVYGKNVMPILLDDCFAFYDDKRTKLALESLSKGEVGQVIIFTCHNREKKILSQMNRNYHYIDLNNN